MNHFTAAPVMDLFKHVFSIPERLVSEMPQLHSKSFLGVHLTQNQEATRTQTNMLAKSQSKLATSFYIPDFTRRTWLQTQSFYLLLFKFVLACPILLNPPCNGATGSFRSKLSGHDF
eukprot:6482587-Amphidinium_carterae.1